MMKKEMLFAMFAIGCVVNSTFGMDKKPTERRSKFSNITEVTVEGNQLFSHLYDQGYCASRDRLFGYCDTWVDHGYPRNPSSAFEETMVVKKEYTLEGDGVRTYYRFLFQLKDIKRAKERRSNGSYTIEDQNKWEMWEKITQRLTENRGTVCPKDGNVTVLIIGALHDYPDDCELCKEDLRQQK